MPKITYLGSASQYPSPKRAVNSLILKSSETEFYLFDCGPGTVTQFDKTGENYTHISKIFISHLHGDHSYGIHGILIKINQMGRTHPIQMFGPVGLKKLVQIGLETSKISLNFPLKITEIQPTFDQIFESRKMIQGEYFDKNTGEYLNLPENLPKTSQYFVSEEERRKILEFCHLNGVLEFQGDVKTGQGLCLQPDIHAVPITHMIPSIGYVFVFREEAKLAILYGDCNAAESAINYLRQLFLKTAQNLQKSIKILLVHEATLDDSLQNDCIQKGHSTPKMASEYLLRLIQNLPDIDSATLILNHFSQRYYNLEDLDLTKEKDQTKPVTQTHLDQATRHLAVDQRCSVYVARDLWSLDF